MRMFSIPRGNPPHSVRKYSEWSLKSRLFLNMLLLAVLLLLILTVGMVVFGRTTSTEKSYYDALDMQMEVFEKDISTHFESLAASAISMSEEMVRILEAFLASRKIPFASLNDAPADAALIQQEMVEPLRNKLLQANCSGAFVMLNATVNTSLPDSDYSRTGLYLQINGYTPSNAEVLLYRGFTDVAKVHNITPHRKWRLEFRTDLFPGYTSVLDDAERSLNSFYQISELFTLPGTSENVLLLTVPLVGSDGLFYGICGYEISASYFMTFHEQPSKLANLSCLLAAAHENVLISSQALRCSGPNGYFHTLTEDYAIVRRDDSLTVFRSDTYSYLGLTKIVSLTEGAQHRLAVLIPLENYRHALLKNVMQTVILLVFLLFFTISFCRYFSRRFLTPLLTALEQIRSDKREEAGSDIPEILDLIEYLERQDKEHEKTVQALTVKQQEAEKEKNRLQAEYETALRDFERIEADYRCAQSELVRIQTEIERLAYSRKNEIDPADYQFFLAGLQTLTETEKNIFELYLAGKSARDILSLTGIKESTLKFHNHNILGKLGVSSRKQMLRYAEVMRNHREDQSGGKDG